MIQMIYDGRGRRWSLKQRTRRATRLHAAVQPSLERKISRGLDELLYFSRDRNDSKSGLASLFSTRFRNLVMIQRNPKKTKKKTFRRVAFYFRATALKFNLENK